MKLQKTTLILILLALGIGSFVYFYEIKGATQRKEVKNTEQQIFTFEASDVQSLTVKTKNLAIAIERGDKSSETKWLIKSPTVTPVSDAVMSYLINTLVKGKVERTLSIPTNQLGEFGLDQPQATINVKLKNQKTHELVLGNSDFNHRFLYAQADPAAKPNGNTNVLLVSTDLENAVNRKLSDWKEPVDNGKTPTPLEKKL
ncbi:MAG: DUF4340 domain-containing protein [Rhizonema sp. NSF051]|nr:DUF4340 domain-containing protein [Rhizonema sp. NSF051]